MSRAAPLGRFALLVAGLLIPGALPGQTLLHGRVTAGPRPLPKAEIRLEGQQLRVETSDSGAWRMLVPAPGLVELTVRAIGFRSTSRRLVLAGNDTVTVDFALEPLAQRLDSIAVEAPAAVVLGKMKGFEERRRLGFGRFFTREMLAERENSIVSNVLRSGTGLRMVHRPETCGGGWAAASGRGGSMVREACGPTKFDPACYMAIFLDGVRLWSPGFSSGDPPPDIDRYKVSDFEGVEVYRSVNEAPIQYQVARSDCGAIVLWTRVGHG